MRLTRFWETLSRPGAIAEIAGEAGAGKTQLCLRLLIEAVTSSDDAHAIYISTEGAARTERLQCILREIGITGHDAQKSIMDRIYVIDRVESLQEFFDVIDVTVRNLLEHAGDGQHKLVAVDSIAALFRGEFTEMASLRVRKDWFFSLSAMMRQLGADYGVPFVITNQVSGAMEPSSSTLDVNGRLVRPALGIAWSNCVNARIVLLNNESRDSHGRRRRTMVVAFSPTCPAQGSRPAPWLRLD